MKYMVEWNDSIKVPKTCKIENAGLAYGAGSNVVEYFDSEDEAREYYKGINVSDATYPSGGFYYMSAKELSCCVDDEYEVIESEYSKGFILLC